MTRSTQARVRAQAILDMFHVRRPPVDVVRIADGLGFEVHDFAFPDESTSAVLIIDDDVRGIGVSETFAPTRKRFSIAHELGHYLLGHGDFADSKKTFEDGTYNYLDPQNRQESEANEFAAELLMPEKFLGRDVAEMGLDARALAKRYQVSEQALWIQLISLHLASKDDT
jgi:Zn-dependent peptidase ImmA (M78 family)